MGKEKSLLTTGRRGRKYRLTPCGNSVATKGEFLKMGFEYSETREHPDARPTRRRYRTLTPDMSIQIRTRGNLFGRTLKGMRLRFGLSVKDLAMKTRLSQDYIYKLERGFSPPPGAPRIDLLAEALSASPDALFLAAGVVTPSLANALLEDPSSTCDIIHTIREVSPRGKRNVVRFLQGGVSSFRKERSSGAFDDEAA